MWTGGAGEHTIERRWRTADRSRFEEARRELAQRLAGVCAHMSPEELHELTTNMTRIKFRFERTTAVPLA